MQRHVCGCLLQDTGLHCIMNQNGKCGMLPHA